MRIAKPRRAFDPAGQGRKEELLIKRTHFRVDYLRRQLLVIIIITYIIVATIEIIPPFF